MNRYANPISLDSFTNFGDLLKYLRRREQLTQLELSIKVGYSEAQISRLEKNQRLPDLTGVKALFIPALHLEDEPQLAAKLIELAQSARQIDAPSPGLAPYKGLLYFDESDSELFFGREALTSLLVKKVMDLGLDISTRFLAVVGASGSGKSSLVRAGLAVALRKAGWEVLVLTPNVHPLELLESRINSLDGGDEQRVLILVDQFEEVFTLCRDELERIAFIERLLACAQDKTRKYAIVIALRADFYTHCSQYPLLRKAVSAEQEYIGQMTIDELRQAIEEPAKRNGWEFEPGLVDVMLQDLSTHGSHEPEPGALPLLSHALLATWEHRRGRVLTLSGYHASGGVRGAIAETAESVFTDQLNQSQQEIARDVFLRLTELGEGTEDTRHRAALAELGRQFDETAQFRAVLNTLAEARLITLNEDSVEVAHEALIREWERLHEWLTQDREGLLLHRHLTEAAQEWERRGRDAAELYRGARLAQANEWVVANAGRLNQSERDFLAAALDQEQHEALEREAQRQRELEAAQSLAEAEQQRAEEHKQAAQRLRRRAWQLGAVLGIALVLATTAILFGRQANLNSRLATARELAAASLNNIEVDNERSLLLAMQAVKTSDIPEAETALHHAILAMHLTDTLAGHADKVIGVAYTPGDAPGNARVATSSQDGVIKIWALDNSPSKINHTSLITITNPLDFEIYAESTGATLAFSPDGKQLASIADQYTVKIWDASDGKLLHTLSGHDRNITSVAYSPIGNLLVTGSEDFTAKIWNTQTGQVLQTIHGFASPVGAITFNMDGNQLALGEAFGNILSVWGRTDMSETLDSSIQFTQSFTVETQLQGIIAGAFSPDGKRIAVGGTNIEIYDIGSVTDASPASLVSRISAHQNPINGLSFSMDGNRLISGSADASAKVWDATTGQLLFTLSGNAGPIFSMALDQARDVLFTGHNNGQLKVWDLSTKASQEWLTISDVPIGFSIRPGNRLVNVIYGNEKYIFEVIEVSPEGQSVVSILDLGSNAPNSAEADQALKRLAVTYSNDSMLHIFDLSTGRELISFTITQTQSTEGHSIADISDIKFSPDGRRVVTVDSIGGVFMWEVQTGELLHALSGHAAYFAGWDVLAFSPDGLRIATASSDGTLRIWDADTGAQLFNLPGHPGVYPNVVFSPDGKSVLATGEGSKINLWDVQNGQLLLTLTEYPSLVDNLGISPDGRYLLAAMLDGTTHMWNATSGQEVLTLPGFYTRFTDDGKHLLAWTQDNILYGYILDIDELMTLARARITRTWTQDECVKFLHTEVCPPTP